MNVFRLMLIVFILWDDIFLVPLSDEWSGNVQYCLHIYARPYIVRSVSHFPLAILIDLQANMKIFSIILPIQILNKKYQ